MKYLFIDIEWDMAEEKNDMSMNQIVSIGVVLTDENNKKIKSYFSYIKPERSEKIRDKTLKCIHTSRERLETAKAFSEALKGYQEMLDMADIWIIWSLDAYHILEANLERNNYNVRNKRTIVLQDLLSINIKEKKQVVQIGLKYLLDALGIFVNEKRLHFAYYDVLLLRKIYFKLLERIKKNPLSERAFLKSKYSNIVHREDCVFANHINPENVSKVQLVDFMTGAYTICKCCQPNKVILRTLKKQKKKGKEKKEEQKKNVKAHVEKTKIKNISVCDEKSILRKCEKLGLWCRFAQNVIYVRSKKSYWRIYHENMVFKSLYHQNYLFFNNTKNKKFSKCNEGFHLQKINAKTIDEIISYIYNHDKHLSIPNSRSERNIEKLLRDIAINPEEKYVHFKYVER